MEKKVTPLDTLTSIEKVVEGQAAFRPYRSRTKNERNNLKIKLVNNRFLLS